MIKAIYTILTDPDCEKAFSMVIFPCSAIWIAYCLWLIL